MRQLYFTAALALTAILLAALLLPWWLPVVLRAAAPRLSATFGTYERVGYARFALRDVAYEEPGVRVEVERLELDTPLLWLWRQATGGEPFVQAGTWKVTVAAERPPVADEPKLAGWTEAEPLVRQGAAHLARWLPHWETGAGTVSWPGGEIAVARVIGRGSDVGLHGVSFRDWTAEVDLTLAPDAPLRLQVRESTEPASLDLRATGTTLEGQASLWQQPLTFNAQFGEEGWLPATAAVQAESWHLPAERLRLPPVYTEIAGRGSARWEREAWTVDIDVRGTPRDPAEAPAVEVILQGRAAGDEVTVERLALTAPGLRAVLGAPVIFNRAGELRSPPSQFTLTADLAALPWGAMQGRVSGEARVTADRAAQARVEFQLDGEDVQAGDFTVPRASAAGHWQAGHWEVREGTVRWNEREQLSLRGRWDTAARALQDVSVRGEITPGVVARWLPDAIDFEHVAFSAELSGPFNALVHRGQAEGRGVGLPGLAPGDTTLAWQGTGQTATISELTWKTGATTLTAEGTVSPAAAEVTRLRLTQADRPLWELTAPATVAWTPGWRLTGWRLAGPEGHLAFDFEGGETGRSHVEAQGLSTAWCGDLITLPDFAARWRLATLRAQGEWNQGPMTFSLESTAEVSLGDTRRARLQLTARGDGQGVQIEHLEAGEGGEPVLTATGRLPVQVHPGQAPGWTWNPESPVSLQAATRPDGALWAELGDATGVRLERPDAALTIEGSLKAPRGTLRVRADRLSLAPERFPGTWPTIEQVDLALQGERTGLRLETLTARIDGQALRASGRVPVAAEEWQNVPRALAQRDWHGTEFQLEVPGADLAALARYAPGLLAPKGQLRAEVNLTPAGEWQGFLRVQDAASRPLGPLGVLQELGADIRLEGRQLVLRQVSARAGGQPVTLSGSVTLPRAAPPRFDLALRGQNLPFVRQAGLMVRGDLDLAVRTTDRGATRVTGTARLRQSLFLSDVRALIPSGAREAARRPPYFSVTTPPVGAWELAVDVRGERFLRVRTALFTGLISTRIHLSGTMSEPRAVGEAVVEEGQVLFPFATFKVAAGRVILSEADPYQPRLQIGGVSRRYGYDLRMDLGGTASDPNLTFSSSPPLESQQVLLMVMAGETPRNEVSYSGTQRMARLGAYLGQSLLQSFGGDASEAERLSITSGEKVSRQGRETYGIEYQLTDRWSLVGEYDEFDDYNAGVKWRVLAETPQDETP